MQYFLLPTNLVIVFVHWVSTGVLYEPRQCSLFWYYIPESKLCFCLNLCRPPGTYSIRPIQKLLNCQQRDDAQETTRGARGATLLQDSSRWGATKNSAMALSSRNNMISIHQRSAYEWKQNNADLKLLENCVMYGFVIFGIMFMTAMGLENSPKSFGVSTVSQSRSVVTSTENPAPDNSPQSIGELPNGHVANLQELYYTQLVRKMAWC